MIVILIFTNLFATNTSADAADFESASSLNPVGSGARAMGMGGTFIGLADDATAASWNPAGLIQLEKPEMSATYSYSHNKQTYSNENLSVLDTENTMTSEGLNYASLAFPFELFKRNMTISLNYQRLYEMNKELQYNLQFASITGSIFDSENSFIQEGFLYAFSPALAVQATPEFYLGVTLNLWDNEFGRNGWAREENQVLTSELFGAPFEAKDITIENVSFEGKNANLGFLWKSNGTFTLGGV